MTSLAIINNYNMADQAYERITMSVYMQHIQTVCKCGYMCNYTPLHAKPAVPCSAKFLK